MDHFSIADATDGSDAAAALYREELNGLKIEKLSNRVTLISVLLPCLIGAIIAYAYYDFKNSVTTLQDSGVTQVERLMKDFEVKINTIEVDLAKMKFSMEKEIPELNAQTTIMMEKIATLSDLVETKIGRDEVENILTPLEAGLKETLSTLTERMDTISSQHQSALNILDRTSNETLDIVNQNAKNLEIRMEKKVDEKIGNAIATAFDEKLATYAQTMEDKVTNLSQSVESKLAALQEVVEVLSENKNKIAQLDKNLKGIKSAVAGLTDEQKKVKSEQQKMAKSMGTMGSNNTGVEKSYVDRKMDAGEKRLIKKIDQLDLKISKEIIKLKVAIDSPRQSNQSSGISQSDLAE